MIDDSLDRAADGAVERHAVDLAPCGNDGIDLRDGVLESAVAEGFSGAYDKAAEFALEAQVVALAEIDESGHRHFRRPVRARVQGQHAVVFVQVQFGNGLGPRGVGREDRIHGLGDMRGRGTDPVGFGFQLRHRLLAWIVSRNRRECCDGQDESGPAWPMGCVVLGASWRGSSIRFLFVPEAVWADGEREIVVS